MYVYLNDTFLGPSHNPAFLAVVYWKALWRQDLGSTLKFIYWWRERERLEKEMKGNLVLS